MLATTQCCRNKLSQLQGLPRFLSWGKTKLPYRAQGLLPKFSEPALKGHEQFSFPFQSFCLVLCSIFHLFSVIVMNNKGIKTKFPSSRVCVCRFACSIFDQLLHFICITRFMFLRHYIHIYSIFVILHIFWVTFQYVYRLKTYINNKHKAQAFPSSRPVQ